MPLDPHRVMEVVKAGLSPVCATCTHYWRGMDAGLAGCGRDCAGPISGDNFPEYDGELPNLVRFCFVCGKDSTYALQVGQKENRVGVCEVHLSHLNELVSKSGIVQTGQVYAVRGGAMIRVERIFRRPDSLALVMHETEKAWKEEDRHNAEKLGIDPDTLVEN